MLTLLFLIFHQLKVSSSKDSQPLPWAYVTPRRISTTINSSKNDCGEKIPSRPFLAPNENQTQKRHIRILKRRRTYDVQTRISSFLKQARIDGLYNSGVRVDVHSLIHFGERSYYDYFNVDTFEKNYDCILYELIVGDDLLENCDCDATHSTNAIQPPLRKLKPTLNNENPIIPTLHDRKTASQYGLTCQVDGIRYSHRDNWMHADLTREEFINTLHGVDNEDRPEPPSTSDQPLWFLASSTSPLLRGFFNLVRPPTAESSDISRRLFTHLFLPGNTLTAALRFLLWMGPSPELSIPLIDWSTGGNGNSGSISPLSPMAVPVVVSLLFGQWGVARRFMFGQVLAGGQSAKDRSKHGVLIHRRNDRAMHIIRGVMEDQRTDHICDGKRRIALLYGAAHSEDLTRRLIGEGFVSVSTEWRTAFRATMPNFGEFFHEVSDWKSETSFVPRVGKFGDYENLFGSANVSSLESVAVSLVVLPLYLLIGGLDWVSTMGEVGNALNGGLYLDVMAIATLYLTRHVALYVAISKFIVDWGEGGVLHEDGN